MAIVMRRYSLNCPAVLSYTFFPLSILFIYYILFLPFRVLVIILFDIFFKDGAHSRRTLMSKTYFYLFIFSLLDELFLGTNSPLSSIHCVSLFFRRGKQIFFLTRPINNNTRQHFSLSVRVGHLWKSFLNPMDRGIHWLLFLVGIALIPLYAFLYLPVFACCWTHVPDKGLPNRLLCLFFFSFFFHKNTKEIRWWFIVFSFFFLLSVCMLPMTCSYFRLFSYFYLLVVWSTSIFGYLREHARAWVR